MGAQHYTDDEIEAMGREYNKIFTGFQKLDEKILHWTCLKPTTKDKWDLLLKQQQLNALKEQITTMKEQGDAMRAHTRAFYALTVANIIIVLASHTGYV